MPTMAMDHPLRPVAAAWVEKIRLAWDVKKKQFQNDADEAMKFYNGPHDFMYSMKYATSSGGFTYVGDTENFPRPSFGMTVNKVAEMVQLFGPVLYHRNPIRQVNPRKAPMLPIEALGPAEDPMVQEAYFQLRQPVERLRGQDHARAVLLEHYLNYTPVALGLKDESRMAIDEALIKGLGVMWTELYRPRGSQIKLVGSFYDTVDNLVVDPDVEELKDAQWIARRVVEPVWKVERDRGLDPGALRGNAESFAQQAEAHADPSIDYWRRAGHTNDLLVYWKVWSKMGLGGRLKGVRYGMSPEARTELDSFGDNCYLEVAEGVPYPLNLPPAAIDSAPFERAFLMVQWPTPYWADESWPFTPICFHSVPRQVWPMSHLKPGMGELKFINWAYSFLAGKIKTACRDFIAIAKSAGEEIKNTILRGTDYELIEIEHLHGTISEVVQFLQHPQFQGDIYKVIQAVELNFEKRVGLTELMYGLSATQLRSATEAQVKQGQLQVRPDDMAQKVEDAMTEVARREALAARWHLNPEDVAPVLGQSGSQWWAQYVMPASVEEVLHQLEYRIEAGSARKPNKDRDASNMNQALQVLLQPLLQLGVSGDPGPVNALIADWAKSIDLDPARYLIKPPPPPPPPAPSGGAPAVVGGGSETTA